MTGTPDNETPFLFYCDMSAMSPEERTAHQELIGRLFGDLVQERRELADGFAYRFDTPEGSICYSGDSGGVAPGLIELARGVDVLVHMNHYFSGTEPTGVYRAVCGNHEDVAQVVVGTARGPQVAVDRGPACRVRNGVVGLSAVRGDAAAREQTPGVAHPQPAA